MNNREQLKRLYIGLIILVISISALWVCQSISEEPVRPLINQIRVLIHPIYEKIKVLDLTLDFDDVDVRRLLREDEEVNQKQIIITLIDLTGKVIDTTGSELKVNDKILVEESLYMDQSYVRQSQMVKGQGYYKLSLPIYHLEKVNGFAIFEVNQALLQVDGDTNPKDIGKVLWIPIGLTLCLLLALGWIGISYENKSDMKVLIDRLASVTKGELLPIDLEGQPSAYKDIYRTYNSMIEELSYVSKQQMINDGKRKRFLTMISHELKTPIATINAYVEGILHGIAKDEATHDRYLKIIHQKMIQLTTQIEELFEYAQEASDQFKYHFEECYCDELFDGIVKGLEVKRPMLINIQNKIPKCIVNVDKVRIEQVVMNIYNNAIKHSRSSGCIHILGYRQDDDIFIEISDDGEGIEPADLPYIFDYYYQGQLSKKEDYEGVGLGLAICREIINKHSGQIRVKSQVGKGTMFVIQIPVV